MRTLIIQLAIPTISVLNGSRSCTPRTRLSRIIQTPTHQRLLKSLKIHACTLNVLFTQRTAELAVLERIYYIISNQNRPALFWQLVIEARLIPAVFDPLMCLRLWIAFVGTE